MAMADITVMGAGVFGLAIAYECARRGARVQVIEKRHVGAGSSGGIVGALAPHTPERWEPKKQFQLESLLMAEDFWREVDCLSGLSAGYGRIGRLLPIDTPNQLELARMRTIDAQSLWQGKAEWRVVAREQFAPWAPPSGTGYLIQDTLSARMHPRMALASLAGALRASGGRIIEGKCTPPESRDNHRIVWATGYEGLAALSQDQGVEAGNGVKGQSALLGHDAGTLPQLYAGGVHIVPHADGTVAVGSTSERYFDDPASTDAQLDELLARVKKALPLLADAPVLERWAGVRPRAATRAPMMGAWPERPGHYILNGGFKIGFGMVPKLAGVMADLLLEDRDAIPQAFRVEASLGKLAGQDQ